MNFLSLTVVLLFVFVVLIYEINGEKTTYSRSLRTHHDKYEVSAEV
jgi:hypothetical protein